MEYPIITETSYQYGPQSQVLRPSSEGTWFAEHTPPIVRQHLDYVRVTRQRVELTYGNQDSGLTFGDDPELGYIGRSTGAIKVPLLIHNNRSTGGPAILDHCIIRIRSARGKHVIYQHPQYHEQPTAMFEFIGSADQWSALNLPPATPEE